MDLISRYLRNRTQYVPIDNHHLSCNKVEHGVPQDSLLGPLLFIIYTNDLIEIDTSVQYIMYADGHELIFIGFKCR